MKFFYNGIKGSDGKLQKCHYRTGPWIGEPNDMIKIYARSYNHFSSEVRKSFIVTNDSDGSTDYFETDSIRVYSNHPLYQQVKEALNQQTIHDESVHQKRMQKVGA